MAGNRQLPLLLVLATLGAALILYRLALSGERRPSHVPRKRPLPDDSRIPHGPLVWKKRIVAVGDLHGDLKNAKTVLRMARIIDDDDAWIAGNDTLVQTGDMVDRGTDTIALYRLFQSLRGQARAAGGEMYSILGNHEMMNALGDWRYVTKDDIATFGSISKRQDLLSDQGWIGQEWLSNYTVTAKVPLTPYNSSNHHLAFSHGSLHPNLALLTPFPENPNAIGHSLLAKALRKPMPKPHPPYSYPGLPSDVTKDEITIYGENGVLWWRGLATEDDEAKVCAWAKTLQERLGVRKIIGGHTPNFEEIVSRCNGEVVVIDTGISKAYGGVSSALEIVYSLYDVEESTEDHPHDLQVSFKAGKPAQRLREVEEVTALYPGGKRVTLDRRSGLVELQV
ncbi:hypothetical protein NliqN6_4899 [Naganishia liquefaciens]|uniref:Calcineurin-like phosphoesterase domain-containing protein n=1 Tax=Naganishia liquefaciens TaxID=104408 RepID=A0A8H3YHS6_9TREE|nr:hypothetical protein NliqN6_4899 [Naganishia liquefaciens]